MLAGGTVWSTSDAGRTWRPRGEGFAGAIEAIGTDPSKPQGLWAVVGGQILHSPRPGEPWGAVGTPLPERTARARALAIMGDVIVVATDQGPLPDPGRGRALGPAAPGTARAPDRRHAGSTRAVRRRSTPDSR